MKPATRVRKIADALQERFPYERSRHDEPKPFLDTLIAVTLSQNTSDVNSHRAYRALRSTWPRWEEVLDAGRDELKEVIRVSGLADQKSKTIIGILRAFRDRWNSFDPSKLASLPDDELLEWLTEIPGVGVKTASCAMMFALDRDLCAVDTHIHRIANRVGLTSAKGATKVFDQLREWIPEGRARQTHVAMIQHGRNICKARNPHCFECPIYSLCGWEEKKQHRKGRRQGPKPVSGDFFITDGVGRKGE